MLCSLDRAMLLRLLELFILLCSVMVTVNSENPTTEPSTVLYMNQADYYTMMYPSSESHTYPSHLDMRHAESRSGKNMWLPPANHKGDDIYHWVPGAPPGAAPPNICLMLMNASVPPPASQVPLSCICDYCKKTTRKGDHGDRGLPGLIGSPGSRGITGYKGTRGFTGMAGDKGQKGDMGNQGLSGITGFLGPKGERGFKGEKGDQGSLGNPGPLGPQGEKGTCPASCQSAPGSPGPEGPPGSAGGRGLPGVQGIVGSKGMKGAKGDLGRPGDQGMMGVKGPQGAQGWCNCTDGMDGYDGQPGEKGDKGDKGDTGSQGVQGPMGMTGMKGDMGFMGPPGRCSPAIQSAFSASLNESFPKSDWPVAFHAVFTNRQGHFNSSMGMYTAPVNGTYVFSFHLAVAVKPLKVGLFRNYKPVFKSTEIQNPTTTSQKVVLHLSWGDQVWLQVKSNKTNGLYSDGESSSTFSGYLLYPDSCEFPLIRNFRTGPTGGNFSWGNETM